MATDILVIDDEKDITSLISDILSDEKFITRVANNSDQALKALAERVPTAIILDIWLQGSELDGLGILEIVQKKYPHVPVVMISGHGNIETAVTAIRLGAYDYIEKPSTKPSDIIGTAKTVFRTGMAAQKKAVRYGKAKNRRKKWQIQMD